MDLLTRRVFIERFAALTTGTFVASSSQAFVAAGGEPHISFPVAPRDRVAIASYPFRAYIESPTNRDRDRNLPGMGLTEFVSQVVRKFNIHNIEPHSRHFYSLDPDYLNSFREVLKKTNTKVVNIAVHSEGSFYDADLSMRRKAIAYAKKWVDVAVQIGSPSIRTHINVQITRSRMCSARRRAFWK